MAAGGVASERVAAVVKKLQEPEFYQASYQELADTVTSFARKCDSLLKSYDDDDDGDEARKTWEQALVVNSDEAFSLYASIQNLMREARGSVSGADTKASHQKARRRSFVATTNPKRDEEVKHRDQVLALMSEAEDAVDDVYVRVLVRAIKGPAPLKPKLFAQVHAALNPKLSEALNKRDLQVLSNLLKRECDGVFSVDMLNTSWMTDFIPEADQLATFSQEVGSSWLLKQLPRFYSLNHDNRQYAKPGLEGVILNNFPHTKAFIHELVKQVIEPVSQAYFEQQQQQGKGATYRWLEPLYAHIVSYSMDKGVRGHFPHYDESGITINICLGKNFKGGALVVQTAEGKEIAIPQVPGRAIVHDGSCLHSSQDITSGERYNLVIWCSLHECRLETFNFLDLPTELNQAIVDLLPPPDLCRLRLASRTMNELVEASNRWQWEAEQSQFMRKPDDNRSWRQLFMESCTQHRLSRLKGERPLAPLVATRFYSTPLAPVELGQVLMEEEILTRMARPLLRTADFVDDIHLRLRTRCQTIDVVPRSAQPKPRGGCQLQ